MEQTSVALRSAVIRQTVQKCWTSGAPCRQRLGSAVAQPESVSFAKVTLALFVLCQASDGLLTYFAVSALGTAVEGNPILATWMAVAGAGPTLVVAKIAACACGIVLYRHGTHRALATLTALYLLVAVAPWVYLLSSLRGST